MGSTMPPDPREYGPGPFKKPPPINAVVIESEPTPTGSFDESDPNEAEIPNL